MNKLLCMLAFTRLVECGGMAAAGQQLGLTASAVAKCLARLEADLGVQLLTRTTRALRVTELGNTYYQHCVRVLREIEAGDALVQARHGEATGTLRMRMAAWEAEHLLVPALGQFRLLHPRVQLDLRLGDAPCDLLAEGLDLAVLPGPLPSSTCIARSLLQGRLVTAASPAYLARHGSPATLAELAAHECIQVHGEPWRFAKQGRDAPVAVRSSLTVDSQSALRAAALAGLGLVQARSWAIASELAAGQLRPVLVDQSAIPVDLMAVTAPQRHVPGKVLAMIDFLRELAQQRPGAGRSTRPPLPARSPRTAHAVPA